MQPFDKVLKHAATAAGGDALAYLNVAVARV